MKSYVTLLFVGFFLMTATNVFSQSTDRHIECTQVKHGSGPKMMPGLSYVYVEADDETFELSITFIRPLISVVVSISQNGTVLDSEARDAVSVGQTIIFPLEDYSNGDYTLSITSDGDGIAEYTITIE